MASSGTKLPKKGIVFVEARVRDEMDLSEEEAEVLQRAIFDCLSAHLLILQYLKYVVQDRLSAPAQILDMKEDILAQESRKLFTVVRLASLSIDFQALLLS